MPRLWGLVGARWQEAAKHPAILSVKLARKDPYKIHTPLLLLRQYLHNAPHIFFIVLFLSQRIRGHQEQKARLRMKSGSRSCSGVYVLADPKVGGSILRILVDPEGRPTLEIKGLEEIRNARKKGIEVVVLTMGFRFTPIAERGLAGRFYASDKAEV